MRSLLEYKGGELVQIVDIDELMELVELYELDFDNLFPNCLFEDIAGKKAAVRIPPRELMKNNPNWDGLIPVLVENGIEGRIPMVGFEDLQHNIPLSMEEDDDDLREYRYHRPNHTNYVLDYHDDGHDYGHNANDGRYPHITTVEEKELQIVRHGPSEDFMIQLLAAETIQEAYRRYRACRDDIKLRKAMNIDKLVNEMAAQTIQNSFKRLLSKANSKINLQTNVDNDNSSSNDSKIATKNWKSMSDEHHFSDQLVIDEAFSMAKNRYTQSIILEVDEVNLIVEALGYHQQSKKLMHSHKNQLNPIEFPLTDSILFASILSKYIYSNSINISIHHDIVTKEKAVIAIQNIKELIIGPYHAIKEFISSTLDKQAIEPQNWSNHLLSQLLSILQIPIQTIHSFDLFSGKDFLTLDLNESHIRDKHNIKSSILWNRLKLYQHMFDLIHQWWNKEIKSPINPSILLEMSRPILDNNNKNLSTSNVSKVNGIIEIMHKNILFESMLSFNRTYAWNISIDNIHNLCNILGNRVAILIDNRLIDTNSSNTTTEYTTKQNIGFLEEVKGCRWIRLVYMPDMEIHNLYHSHSSMLSSIIRILPDSYKLSYQTSYPHPHDYDHADRNNSNNSYNHSIPIYAILVPLLCVNDYKPPNRSVVDPNTLIIGNIVRLTDYKTLQKLYKSLYDSNDRPNDSVINQMANQKAEIVSIKEVFSRNRIGVRCIQKDSYDIYDTVPIEGILPINDHKATISIDSNKPISNKNTKNKKYRSKSAGTKYRRKNGTDNIKRSNSISAYHKTFHRLSQKVSNQLLDAKGTIGSVKDDSVQSTTAINRDLNQTNLISKSKIEKNRYHHQQQQVMSNDHNAMLRLDSKGSIRDEQGEKQEHKFEITQIDPINRIPRSEKKRTGNIKRSKPLSDVIKDVDHRDNISNQTNIMTNNLNNMNSDKTTMIMIMPTADEKIFDHLSINQPIHMTTMTTSSHDTHSIHSTSEISEYSYSTDMYSNINYSWLNPSKSKPIIPTYPKVYVNNDTNGGNNNNDSNSHNIRIISESTHVPTKSVAIITTTTTSTANNVQTKSMRRSIDKLTDKSMDKSKTPLNVLEPVLDTKHTKYYVGSNIDQLEKKLIREEKIANAKGFHTKPMVIGIPDHKTTNHSFLVSPILHGHSNSSSPTREMKEKEKDNNRLLLNKYTYKYSTKDIRDYSASFENDLLRSDIDSNINKNSEGNNLIRIGVTGKSIESLADLVPNVSEMKDRSESPVGRNEDMDNHRDTVRAIQANENGSNNKNSKGMSNLKKKSMYKSKSQLKYDEVSSKKVIEIIDGLGIIGPNHNLLNSQNNDELNSNPASSSKSLNRNKSMNAILWKTSDKINNDGNNKNNNNKNNSNMNQTMNGQNAKESSTKKIVNNNLVMEKDTTRPSSAIVAVSEGENPQPIDLVFHEVKDESKPLYSTIKPRPKSATLGIRSKPVEDSDGTDLVMEKRPEMKMSVTMKIEDRKEWTPKQQKLYDIEMKRSEKESINKEKYLEKELRRLQKT